MVNMNAEPYTWPCAPITFASICSQPLAHCTTRVSKIHKSSAARKFSPLSLIERDFQVVCGSHEAHRRTHFNLKYNIRSCRYSYTSARVTTIHSCLFKLFSHCFACVFIKRCVSISHFIRCHALSRFVIIVSNWFSGIQIIRHGKPTAKSSSLLSISKNFTSNRPLIASSCTAKSGTSAHQPTIPPTKGPFCIKETANVAFREAYCLSHPITSPYCSILPSSTKCFFNFSVCHNEIAQARHKFVAKAQVHPTVLANSSLSVRHLNLSLLYDSTCKS